MKTLAEIKKDIEFNKGLSALIETLKSIAVSQYRSLEKKIKLFTGFNPVFESFFDTMDINSVYHPFLQHRNKPQIVVAVTSDSGLLGGLNLQVINTAVEEIEKIQGKIIVIGERGQVYLRGRGIPTANFPGIIDEERHSQAMQVRDYMVKEVLSGAFGQVKVVYPRPISFTVQRIETISFLPYVSQKKSEAKKSSAKPDTIMESAPSDIAEYLIYLWMGHELYNIFGMSRLAEFAARYIHLEESAQKLKDIDKKTKLEYFRVRHELVDRTMRELFAAQLLYKRG
ncbi:MAG: FoF1 ATP synthase subunit gamma [Candidatus Omnitrophota bacterium]